MVGSKGGLKEKRLQSSPNDIEGTEKQNAKKAKSGLPSNLQDIVKFVSSYNVVDTSNSKQKGPVSRVPSQTNNPSHSCSGLTDNSQSTELSTLFSSPLQSRVPLGENVHFMNADSNERTGSISQYSQAKNTISPTDISTLWTPTYADKNDVSSDENDENFNAVAHLKSEQHFNNASNSSKSNSISPVVGINLYSSPPLYI